MKKIVKNKIPQTIAWIENHLDRKINTEIIANKLNCSKRYVSTLFYKNTGVTIATYIRLRRLTMASLLLRETGRSITEISMMYGFEYVQTFSKIFKNHFQLSPLQYRKASCWDMNLFFPSALINNIEHTVQFLQLEDKYLLVSKQTKLSLNLGYNFFLKTKNGNIDSFKSAYSDCIDFIFEPILLGRTLVVKGMLIPVYQGDTELVLYSGSLSNIYSLNSKKIHSGKYIVFSFKGNPFEIMAFHAWCKGHGLYKYKCILKRGSTFSSFTKVAEPDIYFSRYFIPIV
ncbi:AraC family transcriptional regulator [Salmonella enterica subsp. enterica serovar Caracas]|nr:AraC family transcriptional regulator [Salmonella enterica subsp. enterica serovar Caracas]